MSSQRHSTQRASKRRAARNLAKRRNPRPCQLNGSVHSVFRTHAPSHPHFSWALDPGPGLIAAYSADVAAGQRVAASFRTGLDGSPSRELASCAHSPVGFVSFSLFVFYLAYFCFWVVARLSPSSVCLGPVLFLSPRIVGATSWGNGGYWGGRRVVAGRWPARNRVDLVTQGLNAGPSGEPAPSPSTMGPCERTRALQGRPAGTWAGAPRPPYQGVPASPRSARSGSATLATRATTQVPLTLATALQCCLPARTTVPRTLVPLVPASHVKALPEPDSSPLPACMRAAMGCRQ